MPAHGDDAACTGAGVRKPTLALIKIDPADNVPFLAPLLNIPFANEHLPALAPEEVRRRQLGAMTNWVIAGARSQPIVPALEDVHWADPTTVDFIRGIAERGAQAPLLVTARPEFRPPWGIRSHQATLCQYYILHAGYRAHQAIGEVTSDEPTPICATSTRCSEPVELVVSSRHGQGDGGRRFGFRHVGRHEDWRSNGVAKRDGSG